MHLAGFRIQAISTYGFPLLPNLTPQTTVLFLKHQPGGYRISDNTDAGKIFIWAQVGEKLKEIDEKRILSISQQDSNYSLSIQANEKILEIVQQIKNGLEFKDIKSEIDDLNYKDDMFRQVVEFLHEKPHDLLSIGSFITGELESKTALLDLSGDSK